MIAKLKLNKVGKNRIQVIDKSEYDCSTFPSKFLYENTISINYLQKITSDSSKVEQVFIAEHDNPDETVFEFSKDGYYRVNHLIIPTKEWLDKLDLDNVIKFDKIYFYMDGDVFEYNFRNKQATKVDPILLLGVCDLKTTVFHSEEDFVSINNLENCLINYINNKFSTFDCSKTVDKNQSIKLDYIYMIYNVLDYYISCGDLLEAERILEDFLKCYNICDNITSKCECV